AAQGSDANPCTFSLPCRTFQHAHDVVAANGEIDVLDPAGYGKVVITKAISIQGHGFAGLAVTSGDGITINSVTPIKVSLRGLLLDGVGSGGRGILFLGIGSLDIQDCVIRNFTNPGIWFEPNDISALSVSYSHITATAFAGIYVDGIKPSGTIHHVVSGFNN